MNVRSLTRSLAVAVLLASPALAAETFSIDKSHSEAGFQVRHLVTKVRGRFRDFSGTLRLDRSRPDASTVELTIQAASVDTDNENRDQHLRSADFFDSEKYPTLGFVSSKVVPRGKDAYDVTGTLTIRGISKQVTLPVTFLGFVNDPWGGERAGFETSLTVNRKDFGMVWNKALDNGGVVVGDEAAIAINIEAVKQKEAASK